MHDSPLLCSAAETVFGRWFRGWGYRIWWHLFCRLSATDRVLIQSRIESLGERPLFTLILTMPGSDADIERTIASLNRQCYDGWELLMVSSTHRNGRALGGASKESRARWARREDLRREVGGAFVAFLDPGDRLAEQALYLVAEEVCAHPDADVIYADEDRIDREGRHFAPWFKSDWNPDLMRSQNCVGRLVFVRTSALSQSVRFSDDHSSLLAITDASSPERIRHIPHVLYHRAVRGSTVTNSPPAARIRHALPEPPPPVSVVVPTRDRVDLMRKCAEGILFVTDYPELELVIVNNQSVEYETLRFLESIRGDSRVRVLDYDAPFDFAALNNWAVARSKGDVIAFVNNDVEVISPDWLSEMVVHAVRPEIGAVGAKLYYPDDTIQHAGVVLGVAGIAGHAHHRLSRKSSGYFGRASAVQDYSAVTAACMVLRREVFDAVGGFDAENFRVAFNDVDLCLRIGALGYRILWTPFAELYHHESASLGGPRSPQRRRRFEEESRLLQERWGGVIRHDPAYNPNLSLRAADFSLAFPPRAPRPWRVKRG